MSQRTQLDSTGGKDNDEKQVANFVEQFLPKQSEDLKTRYIWETCANLRYTFNDFNLGSGNESYPKVCKYCAQVPKLKLLHCPRCGVGYCSKECQKLDWKRSHKARDCKTFQSIRCLYVSKEQNRTDEAINEGLDTGDDLSAVLDDKYKKGIERLISRLRIYICPYTVGRQRILGKDGFLLVELQDKVEKYIYDLNGVSMHNEKLDRSIVLEYLTVAEYTSRMKENFELGVVLESLMKSVKSCNIETEMVGLVVSKCGWLGVLKSIPLVPDFGMCLQLGKEHEKLPQLLLNIDT